MWVLKWHDIVYMTAPSIYPAILLSSHFHIPLAHALEDQRLET